MSLQSIGFFGFLLIVAAVYLHLPQRWQNPFLLAASWYFYAKAMPAMLPVTIAVAACTYACGRAMQRHKTAALRVSVIGLLVILAFFKYNGAFAADGGWQAVAMPLGISFYSFAAISYLIDAARGDCEVETNFIDCVLYLNFFATITQGPICRSSSRSIALMPPARCAACGCWRWACLKWWPSAMCWAWWWMRCSPTTAATAGRC